MALKIATQNNLVVFTDTETGVEYPYNKAWVEARYTDSEIHFEHTIQRPQTYPFRTHESGAIYKVPFTEVQDSEGTLLNTKTAIQEYLSDKLGFNAAGAAASTTALLAQTGYGHTGAFAGKPLSNDYVWEAGTGITYTQDDVDNDIYKVLSLDNDVHLAVDNPYWTTPDVSGGDNVDLFNGYALPHNVTTLFDYEYDFDTEYPASTGTGFEGSTGRIRLNDLQYGDQLRVRFDFNVIPQVANTTVEPALWYSNRNDNDDITFTFPLTTSPIFYGGGTVGKTYLNRTEISAWVISNEDVNALTLPSIKSDNPVIIQPLGLLVTVLR
jgi:hypothetical protein